MRGWEKKKLPSEKGRKKEGLHGFRRKRLRRKKMYLVQHKKSRKKRGTTNLGEKGRYFGKRSGRSPGKSRKPTLLNFTKCFKKRKKWKILGKGTRNLRREQKRNIYFRRGGDVGKKTSKLSKGKGKGGGGRGVPKGLGLVPKEKDTVRSKRKMKKSIGGVRRRSNCKRNLKGGEKKIVPGGGEKKKGNGDEAFGQKSGQEEQERKQGANGGKNNKKTEKSKSHQENNAKKKKSLAGNL